MLTDMYGNRLFKIWDLQDEEVALWCDHPGGNPGAN